MDKYRSVDGYGRHDPVGFYILPVNKRIWIKRKHARYTNKYLTEGDPRQWHDARPYHYGSLPPRYPVPATVRG